MQDICTTEYDNAEFTNYLRIFDSALMSDNPVVKESLQKFITVVTLHQPVGGIDGPLVKMFKEYNRILKIESAMKSGYERMNTRYGLS
jgi:hypothetical protein